jgi:hypothetical protein
MVLGKKKSSTSNVNDESSKAKKKIEEEKKKMESMDSFEKMTIVQKKIHQFSEEEVDEKKVIQVSQKLATPKGIQEAYLNKNFKQALDYFQTIPMKEKKEKKEFLVSGVQSDINGVSQEEEEEEEVPIEKEDMENLTKTNEKLKIKLVITEIAKSQKEKSLRKLLSPVASTLNIGPKCGKILFLNKRYVSFCTFCWSLVFRMDK